jgi:aspartyl-tRNA(Asn)/glutamyl-tRNA(Gln) amidotransferase subunit B
VVELSDDGASPARPCVSVWRRGCAALDCAAGKFWSARGKAKVRDMTQARDSRLINGATGEWEIIVGLEVHAQVTSRSKLFSGASTAFGAPPNSHVSLVDAAMPGMLPVINEECVKQAVRTGLGLRAQINRRSIFDRKNYFYPDLPQGYQISQYKSPIVGEGEIQVDLSPDHSIKVGVERLHLEQDAGKSLHDQSPTMSFVDLNRSGVALMEIVSKPDMRSADEAKAYVAKLRTILRYIGSCDGDMEKGNLRADVNVSVRRPGAPLGTRCEIKNVNSIRFIGQAIEAEARRQIAVIEDGGSINQETRLFDPARGETRSMRSKEEAHDYRYFPDPDLLPLEFDQAFIDELKAHLPELPDAKKARFIAEYSLSAYDAGVLVAERETADYYESAVSHGGARRDAKAVANWIMGDLSAFANTQGLSVAQTGIPAASIATLVDLIGEGVISGKIAKEVLLIIIAEDETADPRAIVEARGLKQVTDAGAIERAVDAIIAANPDKVAQAIAKPTMLGWFVGQVMKSTGGKANPQAVNAMLKDKLALR